ncbi:VOC family protein [Neobacillus drentensis]|uniref:VOC family protein n=1 Tax=Neobacillus drentensis TaxID=220684 RepID=UPI002FFEF0CD
MKFSFDHLVWFSKKPEEAIPILKQMGIHVANGGRHEKWGTYNTLSYFGLSYIEFLGIENESIAKKHDENRLITHIVEQLPKASGEGPARIAIRTDSIEKLAIKLKADGFSVYGPIPGERARADGEIIKWSLLFPEITGNELALPFFIQWEKSDEQRMSELEKQGLIGNHSLGRPKFADVGFAVRDLEQTMKMWGRMLDLQPGAEFIDQELNARCRKIELSGTNLLFCTPIGEGYVEKVLKEKGETPFLVNLLGTNQSRFFKKLDGYWSFQ